ncbi:HEAT repeat domain-containing protein [Kitasatospora mediocidica]|uniref:HEAT repeat domain-containing protein n=1 Tax=Kitasatospora mediocidica TaxID=58352 RepID=UPI00068FD086|nr:HEAT repeat domain-containing protein [Kitasatospora mediocidica]
MDNVAGLAGRLMTAARVAEDSQADDDGHAYWAVLSQAVTAGESGESALRCAQGLLGSADVLERGVGCDLAGYAAAEHAPLRREVATALIALAEVETESRVLHSLVCALHRAQDPRAVPVLVRLSAHEDVELRRVVASQIVFSGLPDGPDIRALIRLTRDQDPEVRNWAAFALGTLLEQDTTAIRDALWECTTDEDGEVREEGARGLARRHDPRAVPLIAQLLGTDDWSRHLILDAAAILGVPELLPALAACEPGSAETDEAIAACDPERRARIEDDAWRVVLELERLRPDLGAALSSPRYESVHRMEVTHRETLDAGYDVAALLARAGGDPVRAAELVVSDLTGPAGNAPRTDGPSQPESRPASTELPDAPV